MSSEISDLEVPYNDPIVYERVADILRYKQDNPGNNWREDEENLVFLEINGYEQVIKDLFIIKRKETGELRVFLTFLRLSCYDTYSLEISDPEKIREIENLSEAIPIIDEL